MVIRRIEGFLRVKIKGGSSICEITSPSAHCYWGSIKAAHESNGHVAGLNCVDEILLCKPFHYVTAVALMTAFELNLRVNSRMNSELYNVASLLNCRGEPSYLALILNPIKSEINNYI